LIQREGWTHIDVAPMNAERLDFEDASFDFVTSFHTVSVVSDPEQMMSELVRVCRPGGKILVINHFRSDNPYIARLVDSAGGLTRRLGWRTDLDMDELVSELPLEIEHDPKRGPWSLFRILHATRRDH
ncbi:MAG: class I SAM-dependent methyltransferase, partial [Planctomycetota bacterium]